MAENAVTNLACPCCDRTSGQEHVDGCPRDLPPGMRPWPGDRYEAGWMAARVALAQDAIDAVDAHCKRIAGRMRESLKDVPLAPADRRFAESIIDAIEDGR
jgi:hypothetical protein